MKARHLTRPRLGALVAGLLLAPATVLNRAQAQAPAQKPNILFIMGSNVIYQVVAKPA
jgi:hypothetical protein